MLGVDVDEAVAHLPEGVEGHGRVIDEGARTARRRYLAADDARRGIPLYVVGPAIFGEGVHACDVKLTLYHRAGIGTAH